MANLNWRNRTLPVTALALCLYTVAYGANAIDVDELLDAMFKSPETTEEVGLAVDAARTLHAMGACKEFRKTIGDLHLWGARGNDAQQRLRTAYAAAFKAIDHAPKDQARVGSKAAFDLIKGAKSGTNPWYYEAGFRIVYAAVCAVP